MRIAIGLSFLLLVAACDGNVDSSGGDSSDSSDSADSPSDDSSAGDDPASDELTSDEQGVLETINAEREKAGLHKVTLRADLICAAKKHSQDIGERQECTHDSANGWGPGERVESCGGGGWSGEIVACGQTTPRQAVDGWLKSPGHHDIMLDPDQLRIGVAMHNHYWTAIFDKSN